MKQPNQIEPPVETSPPAPQTPNPPASTAKSGGVLRGVGITLLAFGLLFGTVAGVVVATNNRPDELTEEERPTLPEVAVVVASESQVQTRVTGYGEVRAQFEISLAAEVEGQIVDLGSSFATGSLVDKGALLVQVDESRYLERLALARSAVAQARVVLLQEEREAAQARREWERAKLSGTPDSPLLLHEPQLASARAELAAAEARLISAQLDVERTHIKAPFNAVVLRRHVSPGTYLQPGTVVADLIDRDRVEIRVPLSPDQWALLPEADLLGADRTPLTLTAHDGRATWRGYVLRVERHVESASRQRALIAAVDQPLSLANPLLPGTFVTAEIDGKRLDRVISIPASAMTRRGEVWYVTPDRRLASYPVSPLFERDGQLVVPPPTRDAEIEILVQPLQAYAPGMKVMTFEEREIGAEVDPAEEVRHDRAE
ncbi:Efflux RND transporter periplasmic adaptor subunit [Sulfidibacter corallicola]|uniref:Efflux RND transporter periplasmic adaptor subunit n=1 Tax=Sulfidibacter corallicola TaxID=2818388 RepID=A0A8A4TLX1_SULCO|nr:efflux RND transporter periplasmic adaptor subunit [Sulfidibacter corallicola]QTD50563.1 efflux RND transporter periplasmic adaptor subunit [Sulfidibacter corallicola]